MHGQLTWVTHTSRVLRGNPLCDPHIRHFPVYLPPDYIKEGTKRFPVIFALSGHFGSGPAFANWSPWGENLAAQADRLISSRKMKDCIIVMPDCFTALGGSQYINSSAVGRYEDYIIQELVPWIDTQFPTLTTANSRGVMGKSSGGYGALILAMRHPKVFGFCGSRSGDAYFDFCYRKDMAKCLMALEPFGGSVKKFLVAWRKKGSPLNGGHADVINVLAMAACYAPNAKSPHGFDLPVDTRTGKWNEAVWKRWLKHDPLNLVASHKAALKKLKWIYLECGRSDEYGLLYGARQLSKVLTQHKIRHHYEEFDGGHHHTTYRYAHVLTLMAKRLSF